MNVITAYLDTMFSAHPQTPRMLEAKAELQAMMEDAYASLIAAGRSENEAVGQVISDFGNIDEVAPVLGISSDVAVAAGGTDRGSVPATAAHPPVTLDEAHLFADAHQRTRFRLTAAVILLALSPAAVVFLPAAARAGILPFEEDAAVFTGTLVVLLLAAIGLLLFISAARIHASPRRIAEGRFSTNPAVSRWAEALAERHEHGRIRALQLAVLLSILSPLPLIGVVLFWGDSPQHELWIAIGVVIILFVVAVALGMLLPRAWAHTVADTLTRGAYGRKRSAPTRRK
ncbi:permease prefix domain 1-containing protein [Microbacterium sp.]|uniref:permease prefix domain 1-containing protein n=1 Tax=Microbacterium sp. TaxID=51671 RepID=UPI00281104F2|nr:permease prefix domain 1-containing protein [Microbacterium sp.]